MVSFDALPGAVGDGIGLAHVGNPLTEQRQLTTGTAVALLGDRAVLLVAGEDRLTWLDSLTSQSLSSLPPGVSTEFLVLDPQGHVEHSAAIVDDGEQSWLIVDRADAEPLLGWLTKMRFRLRVQPRDASDEYVVFGGTAAAVAPLPAVTAWADPWPAVATGGWGYAAADPHPGVARDWVEVVVPNAAAEKILAPSDGPVIVGHLAADALRIAAWRPRVATEADGRTLPHEADWLRTAVHLSKGCYRGQETVAKVHNLGHPPRRMVALQLDGSDTTLPEPGDVIRHDGKDVGSVTSVARHFEEGPIALGFVKRTVPVDAELTITLRDDATLSAAQETIVPPDAGREVSVPRLPRLGRR